MHQRVVTEAHRVCDALSDVMQDHFQERELGTKAPASTNFCEEERNLSKSQIIHRVP